MEHLQGMVYERLYGNGPDGGTPRGRPISASMKNGPGSNKTHSKFSSDLRSAP